MALIACPDCEKQISDSSSSCIHCGRPLGGVAVAAPPVEALAAAALGGRVVSSPYACPKCSSEEVKRLSMIYQEGTAAVESTTSGAGLAGGSLGVGAAHTKGTSRTLASIGAAPPERKKIFVLMAVLIVFALMTLTSLSMVGEPGYSFASLIFPGALTAAAGWGLRGRLRWNRDVFPREMQRWQDSFRCGRCGNVYQIAA